MINGMTLILILIVNFPFLDGGVSHRPSCGVYISQIEGVSERTWLSHAFILLRKTR